MGGSVDREVMVTTPPCQGDAEGGRLGASRPHGTVNVQLRYRGRGKPSQAEDIYESQTGWTLVTLAVLFAAGAVIGALWR